MLYDLTHILDEHYLYLSDIGAEEYNESYNLRSLKESFNQQNYYAAYSAYINGQAARNLPLSTSYIQQLHDKYSCFEVNYRTLSFLHKHKTTLSDNLFKFVIAIVLTGR